MASTSSLFTGLSGLTTNARRLEVIGNNIANVNTTAFKSSRMLFAPTFSKNFGLGTVPSSSSGGTNPGQVGNGAQMGAIQRSFANGAISATGVSTDMALEGDGFFIVDRGGEQLYTRNGQFQFNASNELVTATGERLQGYTVNEDFELVEGILSDLSVPLGQLTVAEQTTEVDIAGNLNSGGDVAANGSVFDFGALTDGGAPITGTTRLTDLDPAGAYAAGDIITISGVQRGGKVLPDAQFEVLSGSRINDFMDFMMEALGIVPNGGFTAGEPTGGIDPGGYSVAGGVITLNGNWGEINDLEMDISNITVADSAGAPKTNIFDPVETTDADGESVRHTFVVYDSLGAAHNIDVSMVFSHADNTGTFWRTFLHSSDDTDIANHLEIGDRTGTYSDAVPLIHFDTQGVINPQNSNVTVELDLLDTGSGDPLLFDLNLAADGSPLTALSDQTSDSGIVATFQNGSPLGVLTSFSVGTNGIMTGRFDNGLTRTIGQVVVGKFNNPEGLIDSGGGLFSVGPNSGTPLFTRPESFGTGRLINGALELSNTELSEEFINMILTSTGYSASSRVITTSDQLIQQLLLLGR